MNLSPHISNSKHTSSRRAINEGEAPDTVMMMLQSKLYKHNQK